MNSGGGMETSKIESIHARTRKLYINGTSCIGTVKEEIGYYLVT